MSFPRYQSYKDSGVEWLGEVPSHWNVSALKWCLFLNDGGVWGEDEDGEGDTVVLRSTDQSAGGNWQIDNPARRKLSATEREAALLLEGDLLVTKSSGSSLHIGKTTLVAKDVARLRPCFSNFMQRLRLKPGISPKLAWYFLNSDLAREQLSFRSNTSTGLANINGTLLGSLEVAVPALPEQAAVAAFLDRETGKIDALLEAQRRLIELLKEKRQTVISHAVTKGLNPSAPMKDSGVEWLGDVPEHWTVGPLKRTVGVLSGYAFPSNEFSADPTETPLLRGVNVGVGRTRWDDVVYWSRTSRDRLNIWELRAGDVVLGMDRPWIAEGLRVAQLTEQDVPSLLLQRVAAIRPTKRLMPEYLARLLEQDAFHHHCVPEMTGVSVPHISPGQIADFVVALPPSDEQAQILAELSNFSERAQRLSSQAEAAVDLLQERRAALISAAVTGKIDVRGLVAAPEEAQAA